MSNYTTGDSRQVQEGLNTAKPSVKKSIGASHGAPGYIIDPESSALIEIALDSNNDTTISANLYCHEEVSVPDLTQLDGTN